MSHVVDERSNGRALLDSLFSPIKAELAEVEETLRRELRNDHAYVDRLVKHGFRLGGKRLRPALVLLAGQALGRLNREHVVLAAVVEMIHTATLVHDDILDEADLRRHERTVNAQWGNESSVLLGDYLFTHSFYLASTLETTYACRTIGRATNIVCEGELRQIDSRGNFDLSEEDYLSIIDAKTAELCACCCRLGAHCSGAAPEVEEAMAEFGRALGVAFQIVDDLLDLQGDEATAGKSLGADLKQRKATLPVIRLLAQSNGAERAAIIDLLSGPDASHDGRLRELLDATDSFGYARRRAEDYAALARERLNLLPTSPARTVLERTTQFVVCREH